jgi:hypothetical protein
MKLSKILFLTLAAAPWGLLAAYFLTNSSSCLVSDSSFCLIPLPVLIVLVLFFIPISYSQPSITPLEVWLGISFFWSWNVFAVWKGFCNLEESL